MFVVEGEAERKLLQTLEEFYFDARLRSNFVYQFCNNIYEFYEYMRANDFDSVVMALKDAKSNNIKRFQVNKDLDEYDEYEFEQTYLFFDYDIQNNNLSIEQMNSRVKELLHYFNDETGKGKIYINYPMVESIRCTDKLPDDKYKGYRVSIDDCRNFKEWSAKNFTYYGNSNFYLLDSDENRSKAQKSSVRNNWQRLNDQNIKKANYICNDDYSIPADKSIVSQENLFGAERDLVLNSESVSILNSFPLFLFEYFKNPKFLYKKV